MSTNTFSGVACVDMAQVVADFTYKPGVRLELEEDRVRKPYGSILRVHVDTVDTRRLPAINPLELAHQTVVPEECYISEKFAKSFVRQCIRNMELHEMDEWLRYRGELLHDPHDGKVF